MDETTGSEDAVLLGEHVRLEPLTPSHTDGLVAAATAAAAADPSLYQWSPVPQTKADATRYIEIALAWRNAGTAVPFAIVRAQDGAVIGSTRFWNIERWSWPQGNAQFGQREIDACEIGYTWLASSSAPRVFMPTPCRPHSRWSIGRGATRSSPKRL